MSSVQDKVNEAIKRAVESREELTQPEANVSILVLLGSIYQEQKDREDRLLKKTEEKHGEIKEDINEIKNSFTELSRLGTKIEHFIEKEYTVFKKDIENRMNSQEKLSIKQNIYMGISSIIGSTVLVYVVQFVLSKTIN
jgi:predicted XRE-type DNA-binding protein